MVIAQAQHIDLECRSYQPPPPPPPAPPPEKPPLEPPPDLLEAIELFCDDAATEETEEIAPKATEEEVNRPIRLLVLKPSSSTSAGKCWLHFSDCPNAIA